MHSTIAQIIVMLIFFGLFIIGMVAFINFDRLIKIQHGRYKADWVKDGKPRGMYWKPPELSWFDFGSSISMQKLSVAWLFKTPQWASADSEAKECLRKMRMYVIVFYVAVIFLFIICMP